MLAGRGKATREVEADALLYEPSAQDLLLASLSAAPAGWDAGIEYDDDDDDDDELLP